MFALRRGPCPPMRYLEPGDTPVVTSSEQWNGVSGYYAVNPELIHSYCITICANGSDSAGKAFWHPYSFSAVSDVLVCQPKADMQGRDHSFYLYVCNSISLNSWRFDYFRKCTQSRLLSDVRVSLPMKDDCIDFDFIQQEMSRMPGYSRLMEMME